jgi:hypothetical protein
MLVMVILGFALCASSAEESNIGDEVQSVVKLLSDVKEPLSLKQMLQKIRLIEDWSAEADSELLLAVDSDWGSWSRLYEAKGYSTIKVFNLLGTPADETIESRTSFPVTYICISEMKRYHVLRWTDKGYRKTRTAKITGPHILEILAEEAREQEAEEERNEAEQGGADQPATAPESKPEGNSKPEPESEGRPQ